MSPIYVARLVSGPSTKSISIERYVLIPHSLLWRINICAELSLMLIGVTATSGAPSLEVGISMGLTLARIPGNL